MADASHSVRLTPPQASALLKAVHEVRDRLGVDNHTVRDLTRTLADAAGLPAEAHPWPTEAPLPDAEMLASIRAAVVEHRSLLVQHLRQDGTLAEILIEPYHIRLESGFWYLVCRKGTDRAQSVVRIDRLQSAVASHPFDPMAVDLDRYLDGVIVPKEPLRSARVRFGPRCAEFAKYAWGEGEETPDGGVVIDIPYAHDHWLVRTLMEFGCDFEVLSPAEVREGILSRARATAEACERAAG